MNAQEISIEVPSQGARRATGEGSTNGWKKPERFSARQKAEVVLRLLRGEALDLLSRELGIPAARLTTWREAFLDAGQEAMKTHPLDSCSGPQSSAREPTNMCKMGPHCLQIAVASGPH
jgi:transposase-like protein